jgi:hypothetical protein
VIWSKICIFVEVEVSLFVVLCSRLLGDGSMPLSCSLSVSFFSSDCVFSPGSSFLRSAASAIFLAGVATPSDIYNPKGHTRGHINPMGASILRSFPQVFSFRLEGRNGSS